MARIISAQMASSCASLFGAVFVVPGTLNRSTNGRVARFGFFTFRNTV